jgi:hypothetical protein
LPALPPSCSTLLEGSNHFVVHSTFDVNFWAARLPTVEAARPARCPRCKVASRRPGMRLGLVGHGRRERQVRGPRAPSGPPRTITITARRFLCVECAAVVTVAPRGVARRRHFGAAAIGLALFLFGVVGRTAGFLQRVISGWGPGSSRWRTLGRWIDDAGARRLFGGFRGDLAGLDRRQVAAAIARSVQAVVPASDGNDLERMFVASERLA